MPKDILVTDVDNCAHIANRKIERDVFLSPVVPQFIAPEMLEFAKQETICGYYLITHRSIGTYANVLAKQVYHIEYIQNYIRQELAKDPELKAAKNDKDFKTFPDTRNSDIDDVFLCRFIDNFTKATGKPCFSVSTPDDALHSQCGASYQKLLKPYEIASLKSKKRTTKKDSKSGAEFTWTSYAFASVANYPLAKGIDLNFKNLQLLQVIADAIANNPDEDLVLHVCDDKSDIIKNYLTLLPAAIDHRVKLEFYEYDAFDIEKPAKMIHRGSIQGAKPRVTVSVSASDSSSHYGATSSALYHAAAASSQTGEAQAKSAIVENRMAHVTNP
ncbi:MAG: hypothetical protein P4M14_03235 [Gammaproteobacteria bacterium]|nr:hypothetical protein [Gammaproteobacteria bacterium]